MHRLLETYCRFLKAIMTLLMVGILIPVTIQIISRYTQWMPRYIWTEEAARFCFVWIIMIGAIVAVHDGTHFVVDVLPRPKSDQERAVSNLIVYIAMLVLAAVFVVYGGQFALFGARQQSEMSGLNMAAIYVAFPVTGISWMLFLADKIYHEIKTVRGVASNPNRDGQTAGPSEGDR